MPTALKSKLINREQLQARGLRTVAESNHLPNAAHQIPVAQRKTIITVEHLSCRWPIGDPQQKSFYLCGAQTNAHDSYCARHLKIAYLPVPKPKRAA